MGSWGYNSINDYIGVHVAGGGNHMHMGWKRNMKNFLPARKAWSVASTVAVHWTMPGRPIKPPWAVRGCWASSFRGPTTPTDPRFFSPANLRNPSGHTQAARPLNILRLGFWIYITHQKFESLAGDLSFAWLFSLKCGSSKA